MGTQYMHVNETHRLALNLETTPFLLLALAIDTAKRRADFQLAATILPKPLSEMIEYMSIVILSMCVVAKWFWLPGRISFPAVTSTVYHDYS